MEQKTAEEILREYCSFGSWQNGSKTERQLISAMQAYSKQQQEIAVEKSLRIASENAVVISREIHHNDIIKIVDKKSILSLKPEILKELEK